MKFYEYLNISFSLSEIKTWRNFPNSYQYNNFTELNHFFVKASIFLLISRLLEKKYDKKINYNNFLHIINGYLLAKYSLKDINVELFQNIDKKYIVKYIENFLKDESFDLNNNDKKSLNIYYLENNYEKKIWNISSTIANQLDFINIKQKNYFNIDELINETDKTLKTFFNNSINELNIKNKEDFVNDLNQLKDIFKFIYNSTYQLRWDGNPLIKKLSIGEHQIIVLVNFFNFLDNKLNIELSNDEIFYNSVNLIFHDIAEIYTKDIISPLKKAIPELKKILEEKLEKKAINNLFLKKLINPIKKDFEKVNLFEPFEDKYINNNTIYGKYGKYIDDITALYEVIYNIVYYNQYNNVTIKPIKMLQEKYKNNKIVKKMIKTLLKENRINFDKNNNLKINNQI